MQSTMGAEVRGERYVTYPEWMISFGVEFLNPAVWERQLI